MQASFGHWKSWASSCDLDCLVHYIYTGRNADNVDHEQSVFEKIAALPKGSSVLDFGCGVGRNVIPYARELPDKQFVGYDSLQMLSRADEWCVHRFGTPVADLANLSLESDWSKLASRRFDCIYSTIVLQHIEPSQLIAYIEQIKRMTTLFLVYGRRRNDFGGVSVWEILEQAGLKPANAADIGYSVHGDGEEHLPLCVYRL